MGRWLHMSEPANVHLTLYRGQSLRRWNLSQAAGAPNEES